MFFLSIPFIWDAVCVSICFASSSALCVFIWVSCFLDAFVFLFILLIHVFLIMLFKWVPCFFHAFVISLYWLHCLLDVFVFVFPMDYGFLDAFVISCVLLARMFSAGASYVFFNGFHVCMHAFVFSFFLLAPLFSKCDRTYFSHGFHVFWMRSYFQTFC